MCSERPPTARIGRTSMPTVALFDMLPARRLNIQCRRIEVLQSDGPTTPVNPSGKEPRI